VPFLFLLRRFITFQDLAYATELRDVLSFHPYRKYFCDGDPFSHTVNVDNLNI